MPTLGGDNDTAPLYRSVRYGPVEVFVLDVRGDRFVNATANTTALISPTQLQWLKAGLVCV